MSEQRNFQKNILIICDFTYMFKMSFFFWHTLYIATWSIYSPPCLCKYDVYEQGGRIVFDIYPQLKYSFHEFEMSRNKTHFYSVL